MNWMIGWYMSNDAKWKRVFIYVNSKGKLFRYNVYAPPGAVSIHKELLPNSFIPTDQKFEKIVEYYELESDDPFIGQGNDKETIISIREIEKVTEKKFSQLSRLELLTFDYRAFPWIGEYLSDLDQDWVEKTMETYRNRNFGKFKSLVHNTS